MGPIILYTRAKKLKGSLEQFWIKVQNSKKSYLSGHFFPYNTGLRIFSEKQSGSNNATYCPLHSCKKLGISLDPF